MPNAEMPGDGAISVMTGPKTEVSDFEVVEEIVRREQGRVEIWRHKTTGKVNTARVFVNPPIDLCERVRDEARFRGW
jgi:hypothetical protein